MCVHVAAHDLDQDPESAAMGPSIPLSLRQF